MTSSQRSAAPTRTTAHSQSIGEELDNVLRTLVQVLGKKVVAAVVKKDVRTVQRWTTSGSASAGIEEQRILRDMFQIYSMLSEFDGDHTIRAWFLGMNPALNDHSPVDVLIEGRSRAVVAAARSYVNGA
jgi:negative regulator of replication initiation